MGHDEHHHDHDSEKHDEHHTRPSQAPQVLIRKGALAIPWSENRAATTSQGSYKPRNTRITQLMDRTAFAHALGRPDSDDHEGHGERH